MSPRPGLAAASVGLVMQGSEIKEEAIIKTVMFQKVSINRMKKIQYDILEDLFKYIVGKH